MASYSRTQKTVIGMSLSLIIINMAAIMENADEKLLPAVYKEISETFRAGPSDLGYLTFFRNFMQGIASPLAGILVIKYNRPTILFMGTLFWALSTAAVGSSQYFWQVACLRAVNGLGLAIAWPAIQSFVADSYKEGARGAGFGVLNLIGTVGGIGGGSLATVMAGYEIWGIPGWRFAFVTMAILSSLIGLLAFLFVADPRETILFHGDDDDDTGDIPERENLVDKGNASSKSVWLESWTAMKAVIKLRTFQFIVLQGLVGSLPWTAMAFFTFWFELMGFDHNSAAIITSLFSAGSAIGYCLGGLIADRMSFIYPNSGRIMCAQFSAFMGIIFSWILLIKIPQSVNSYSAFSATMFFMGLTISWCYVGTNGPIFAEVVPVKHRTMIYAFDRAFEISFSSFAAPIVGILAETIYGYDPKSVNDLISGTEGEALALSKGLFTMMVIPFGLCCLFYTPLYLYLRQDRENARTASSEVEEIVF